MRKFPRHLCLILVLLFIIPGVKLTAQEDSTLPCIDISTIYNARFISRQSANGFIPKKTSLESAFLQLPFHRGMIYSGSLPSKKVSQKGILWFNLCNRADTAKSIIFFPGFYYKDIKVYRKIGNSLQRLPDILPPIKENVTYRQINLAAHDSATFYVELAFVKTYNNSTRPRLIHVDRVESFINDLQGSNAMYNMVTFLFCGLLLMMIVSSIATFFQGGNFEFLYYSAYAFFVGAMLFTKGLYSFHPNNTSYFLEGYLDFVMQGTGHLFYMMFMRQFLGTKKLYPFLYHLYNFGVALIIVSICIFSYFHYFTDNYTAEAAVENLTKIALLAMTVVFLVYSLWHWKNKLLRYLFWGNLCLFIFSLVSQLNAMVDIKNLPGLLSSSLFYYEFGLFLELVFFLAALNYKNRSLIIEQTKERERLRTENQMKEYEKELAVYKAQQEERQRISADMHDELGAGMTAIRLMSEIARNKMKESTPVEIERISDSADEVLNKMNAIIWSMNSGNDTLDNLVSYIRSYAIEYFESTQVNCRVKTPDYIEPIEITGDKRRNIFLCVKETLNNALKHAGATEITIDFHINKKLVIQIHDNGKGIDMDNLRQFGNGLKNIARRMETIGGSYEIYNENGTLTKLSLPL